MTFTGPFLGNRGSENRADDRENAPRDIKISHGAYAKTVLLLGGWQQRQVGETDRECGKTLLAEEERAWLVCWPCPFCIWAGASVTMRD